MQHCAIDVQNTINNPFLIALTCMIEQVSTEILEGVKYLHGQGINQLDLKPGNILIDFKGCAKLSDFGV